MKFKTKPDAIAKLMTSVAKGLPDSASVFAEAFNAKPEDRADFAKKMHVEEEHADKRYTEFIERLSNTFITPFDREDLYGMVDTLDNTIDLFDHSVDLLARFEFGELRDFYGRTATQILEMAGLASEAVELIKKPKKLYTVAVALNKIENSIDAAYNQELAELYDGSLDIFVAVKYKIMADNMEQIANTLESFVRTLAVAAIKET